MGIIDQDVIVHWVQSVLQFPALCVPQLRRVGDGCYIQAPHGSLAMRVTRRWLDAESGSELAVLLEVCARHTGPQRPSGYAFLPGARWVALRDAAGISTWTEAIWPVLTPEAVSWALARYYEDGPYLSEVQHIVWHVRTDLAEALPALAARPIAGLTDAWHVRDGDAAMQGGFCTRYVHATSVAPDSSWRMGMHAWRWRIARGSVIHVKVQPLARDLVSPRYG